MTFIVVRVHSGFPYVAGSQNLALVLLATFSWSSGQTRKLSPPQRLKGFFFRVGSPLNDMSAGAGLREGRRCMHSPRTAAFYKERFEPLHPERFKSKFFVNTSQQMSALTTCIAINLFARFVSGVEDPFKSN